MLPNQHETELCSHGDQLPGGHGRQPRHIATSTGSMSRSSTGIVSPLAAMLSKYNSIA
jgi:hypothetical protein